MAGLLLLGNPHSLFIALPVYGAFIVSFILDPKLYEYYSKLLTNIFK